jgi:hypothetical protein
MSAIFEDPPTLFFSLYEKEDENHPALFPCPQSPISGLSTCLQTSRVRVLVDLKVQCLREMWRKWTTNLPKLRARSLT